MSGYVTVNRLSLVQLLSEERKQRAHLKKIAEMQRRGGINNSAPSHFPHLSRAFTAQAKERSKEIIKENDAKSKRLLTIMQSKATQPPPALAPAPGPVQPTSPIRRRQSSQLSQNNVDYLQRIAKIKGIYDVREWQRGFQEHKEHLKLSKDNKLFTPRDMGVNRLRVKTASLPNSKRTTPTSSVIGMGHQSNNNN